MDWVYRLGMINTRRVFGLRSAGEMFVRDVDRGCVVIIG